eukprot:1915147-Pleurochrysis_carterae.AAC.2
MHSLRDARQRMHSHTPASANTFTRARTPHGQLDTLRTLLLQFGSSVHKLLRFGSARAQLFDSGQPCIGGARSPI